MTYLEFSFLFFLLLFVLKTVISIKIQHKHLADYKPSKSQCNLNANTTVIKSNPSLPFNLIDNMITLLLCTTLLRCHIISNDTPVTESNLCSFEECTRQLPVFSWVKSFWVVGSVFASTLIFVQCWLENRALRIWCCMTAHKAKFGWVLMLHHLVVLQTLPISVHLTIS